MDGHIGNITRKNHPAYVIVHSGLKENEVKTYSN